MALFLLLLRVMDEFKDFEIDSRLFRDRPLVTGIVKKRDLAMLGCLILAALVLLNIFMNRTIVAAFLVTLVYCLLMFKFFFWPKIKTSLILALITHNPLAFLLQIYALSFVVSDAVWRNHVPEMLVMCGMFWLPWTAWEIGRKIRVPEDENEYETYSKNLGPRGASAIVLSLVAIDLTLAVVFLFRLHLGMLAIAIGGIPVSAVAVAAAAKMARFMWRPVSESSNFRPVLETFMVTLHAASVAAVLAGRGVDLGIM
jgi:4-hydroxybenzoate polyprenyltransferase